MSSQQCYQFSRNNHISQQVHRAACCCAVAAWGVVAFWCGRVRGEAAHAVHAQHGWARLPNLSTPYVVAQSLIAAHVFTPLHPCAHVPHPHVQIFPEQACREATTTLLLDPRTGQVLRHEDQW